MFENRLAISEFSMLPLEYLFCKIQIILAPESYLSELHTRRIIPTEIFHNNKLLKQKFQLLLLRFFCSYRFTKHRLIDIIFFHFSLSEKNIQQMELKFSNDLNKHTLENLPVCENITKSCMKLMRQLCQQNKLLLQYQNIRL